MMYTRAQIVNGTGFQRGVQFLQLPGLDPDQVNVLEYVLELLQRGFQPRIVNVTPDVVSERLDARNSVLDVEAQWKLAKQADQEIENNHHFLDGVSEDMQDAVDVLLDDMEDSE